MRFTSPSPRFGETADFWRDSAHLLDEAGTLEEVLGAILRVHRSVLPAEPVHYSLHLRVGEPDLYYAHVLADRHGDARPGLHRASPEARGVSQAPRHVVRFPGGWVELSFPTSVRVDADDLRPLRGLVRHMGLLAYKLHALAHICPSSLLAMREATETEPDDPFSALIGSSQAIREARARLRRAAPHPHTALLVGDSGTGKELAARAIHKASGRPGPFIPVNCCELTGELAGTTLFGHVKGSFTGAHADRPGVFRRGHGGTVFLDEINSLPLRLQGMLLRVLQEGEVVTVGEELPRPVDVRVVCATNQSLSEKVEEGSFRADLYSRLTGHVVRMPPLRELVDDIPRLAERFLAQEAAARDISMPRVSNAAYERLRAHDWRPGNVRDLQHVVVRAAAYCDGLNTALTEAHVEAALNPESIDPGPASVADRDSVGGTYRELMDGYERRLLTSALDAADGNVSRAAGALGLGRQRLAYRLAKFGIRPRRS